MLLLSLVTTVEGSNSTANGRSARVESIAESPPTTDSNTRKSVNLRTVLEWSAYVLFAIYIILLLLNPEMPGRKSSQVLGWMFLISIVFAVRLIYLLIIKVFRNKKTWIGDCSAEVFLPCFWSAARVFLGMVSVAHGKQPGVLRRAYGIAASALTGGERRWERRLRR